MNLEVRSNIVEQRNKTKSPLPIILRGLEQPSIDELFDKIQLQLIRLDSVYQTALSPKEKIDIAYKVDVLGMSNNQVAQTLNTHQSNTGVKGARRDVRAAIYHLMPQFAPPLANIPENEKLKLQHLRRIEERSQLIYDIIENPKVKKVLVPLPHVRYVIENYAQFGTLKPLVERYNIKAGKGGIDYINRLVRRFIFSDTVDEGVLGIATKTLFGKWIKEGINWYDEDPDNSIIQAAIALFSREISNQDSYLYPMKLFWEEIVRVDYANYHATSILPRTSEGNDTALLLQRLYEYKKYKTYPEALKKFIKSIVEGSVKRELADSMFPGLRYSRHYKQEVISKGISFFEAVLLSRVTINNKNREKYLKRKRQQLLKNAQDVIKEIRNQISAKALQDMG